MTRNLQYIIEEEDEGKSISEILKEKEFSRAVLIELKKDRAGIRKNGTWARVNETVRAEDCLEICLREESTSENIVPTQSKLDILYEDEDLLVVNKPYDMPIHPSINHYEHTLANIVMYYYEKQGVSHTFRCLNRLDRDTTGITIIAKNLLSAGILSNRLKARQVSRVYVAFVEGMTEEKGTIDLPIGRMENTLIKRRVYEEGGKRAITHYQRMGVLEIAGKPVSVVVLKLETGRTHQIRVHMTAIGHPLLGDFLYNETNHMLSRQALHAMKCEFYHPITGEFMQIIAPFHQDMKALLQQSPEMAGKIDEFVIKLKDIKW